MPCAGDACSSGCRIRRSPQEIEILHARVPGLSDRLAQQIAQLMQALRGLPLQKAPGVAESLDWALALMSLHREHLDARHAGADAGMRAEGARGSRRHARASRGARSHSGRRAREPRFRRVQPRHRLRVRLRVGAAPLMYPFASLPENLAAFCEALRREHGFRIGPGELHDAARALDVVDLTDERAVRHALRPILVGTLDDVTVFDAAFTRFFFRGPGGVPQDQMPATRREPGTGADGREADAAARAPVAAISRRRGRRVRAGRRSDGPRSNRAAMGSKRRRSSRHRATARSTPTRPTRPSCRASSAPGAMPRDRSFAGCIWACRAAGGRRIRDDASTFDARCAPAFRPAGRRCRRVGCAARGGRRGSCCWSTAAAR